jgi:hypothetical protein
MSISQKWLDVFRQEEEQYLAWQDGKVADVPAFVDAPIKDPDKLEAYCMMVEERVRDGVVFDGNEIIEILPWD